MTFMPDSASNFSPTIDLIFNVLLVVSSFLVLLVWVAIIYFCYKYRRGSASARHGPPKKPRLQEILLASFMVVFGLGIFIWAAQFYYKMYAAPSSALEINVVAKQWMWIFHDRQGQSQINLLRVPLGQPVRLVMSSEDVVHSFFVPAFRVKQDVLPGRYTSLWFTPTKLGRFDVLCTQYCGLSHSQMRAIVEVIPLGEYQSLKHLDLSSASSESPGAHLYQQKACSSCHEGAHSIGPSLAGIYRKKIQLTNGQSLIADENYLRRSILEPNADIVAGYPPVMPTFQGQLSETELLNIINYLKEK